MANQNKEHLRKLLNFLNNEIIHEPENSWFVDELRKMITPVTTNTVIKESGKISKIENYLALDFGIDTEFSPCNYSFLDDFLQVKAEADFREMKRYRLGLRGHKIDFPEFCRYVVLQAELLLNFFYHEYYKDNGGINSVLSVISQYNNQYFKPKENIVSVEDIPFNYKLWAFSNQYGIIVKDINLARLVRNELCHRSSSPNISKLTTLYNTLKSLGINIKEDGSIPFIQKEYYTMKEVKEYQFELFLYKQPFDSLERSLAILVDTIHKLVKQ